MKTFKKHELERAVLALLGLENQPVTSLTLHLGIGITPRVELEYLMLDKEEEVVEVTRLGDTERRWAKAEEADSIGVQIRQGEQA